MATFPKEPRQVMINLMYLVLTALLALNVSAEILHAFHVVNRGITNSNSAAENKNSQVMSDFNEQLKIQKEKTQPYYDKAIVTRTIVADFVKQLDNYKRQIIEQSGGWVDKDGKRHSKLNDPEIGNWTPENGDLWDDRNIEVTTRIMVEQGGGTTMEKLIEDTRSKLLALFDKDSMKNVFEAQLPLRVDGPMKNEEGEEKDWVESNFEMVPTIAALTLLNKYENDANNSEMQILDHLYKSINALDIKVDKMQARVIAPATYIMAGTAYKADILVAAFNSTNNPTVYIGPLNANAKKDTTGTYYVKTNLNPVDNGRLIGVEGGIGKYEAMVSQSGSQHYSGAVLIKGPQGEPVYYPFEGDYIGVSATAVVSSENLNVIYAGVANPFSVSVPGFSSDKVSATITEGSFTKSAPGKFVAMLQKSSIGKEVKITVTAQMQDGSTKMIAQLPYKVKRVPDPLAVINGKYENGGPIPVNELKIARGIGAVLREFYFQGVSFNVTSFQCIYVSYREGAKAPVYNEGGVFNEKLKSYIAKCHSGDRFIFTEIRSKGPEGQTRYLNSIPLEIR